MDTFGTELPVDCTDADMEQILRSMFNENYESLKLESGYALTPYIAEIAFQQVLRYWQKLRNVAERVTDTEVKLTLPEQSTPKGRKYTIEGVVDIVREGDRTIMYDIKTHDAQFGFRAGSPLAAFHPAGCSRLNICGAQHRVQELPSGRGRSGPFSGSSFSLRRVGGRPSRRTCCPIAALRNLI
jgi:hypothetical protein